MADRFHEDKKFSLFPKSLFAQGTAGLIVVYTVCASPKEDHAQGATRCSMDAVQAVNGEINYATPTTNKDMATMIRTGMKMLFVKGVNKGGSLNFSTTNSTSTLVILFPPGVTARGYLESVARRINMALRYGHSGHNKSYYRAALWLHHVMLQIQAQAPAVGLTDVQRRPFNIFSINDHWQLLAVDPVDPENNNAEAKDATADAQADKEEAEEFKKELNKEDDPNNGADKSLIDRDKLSAEATDFVARDDDDKDLITGVESLKIKEKSKKKHQNLKKEPKNP